ncbi:MAG: ribonuclease P protein component [Burkholderiales bacterium]
MKTNRWQPLSEASRFEAALRTRPCGRTEHFFVHRLPAVITAAKLSTAGDVVLTPGVDDYGFTRLGLVVPKRFAKRAVTRTLVKRQIRAAVLRCGASLPSADWVVRLRAPIDRLRFPSARSTLLAQALRAELDPLFARLAVVPGAAPC